MFSISGLTGGLFTLVLLESGVVYLLVLFIPLLAVSGKEPFNEITNQSKNVIKVIEKKEIPKELN